MKKIAWVQTSKYIHLSFQSCEKLIERQSYIIWVGMYATMLPNGKKVNEKYM